MLASKMISRYQDDSLGHVLSLSAEILEFLCDCRLVNTIDTYSLLNPIICKCNQLKAFEVNISMFTESSR